MINTEFDINVLLMLDGYPMFMYYVLMGYRDASRNNKKYRFNLRETCDLLKLNYRTAQNIWMAALKKSGFVVEKESNSGNYVVTDVRVDYSKNDELREHLDDRVRHESTQANTDKQISVDELESLKQVYIQMSKVMMSLLEKVDNEDN
jgi:hypothetical protein